LIKILRVGQGKREYPVAIGPGVTVRLIPWLKKARLGPRLCLITNPAVFELYGASLQVSLTRYGFEVVVLTVPEGEAAKSLESAGELYTELSRHLAERNMPLLALGGGVIGDLAGFVAATYLRGLPLIHLPTTLLSQVDSSLGGKTAVNFSTLKNQIGVFYPPRVVFSDIETLKTLPSREIANGLAEVIKSAVIGNPRLIFFLEKNMEKFMARESNVLQTVVCAAAIIKASIVTRDEYDRGVRQTLNFGHTIGHAIEAVSSFQVSHGEAIALGMIMAGKIANRVRLFPARDLSRLQHIIQLAGLPGTLPSLDTTALLEAVKHDKKISGGKLRFVLPVRLGQVIMRDIEPALVAEVLTAE
jgi:3-dehydroquinate synthase